MKLNLRDLFWLILVTAVSLAWWLDRSEQVRHTNVAKQTATDNARVRDLWKTHARAAKDSLAVEGKRITYFTSGASLISPLADNEADAGVLSLREMYEEMKMD